MSPKIPSARIEDLKPELVSGIESFELPEGDTGLYRASDGTYLRIEAKLSSIVKKMDGDITLSKLAVEGLSKQPAVSVYSLVSIIRTLAGGGWLTNSKTELAAHGLVEAPPLGHRIRRAWLFLVSWKLQSRRLGKHSETLLGFFHHFPLGNAGIAIAATIALILSGTGTVLYSMHPNQFEDPFYLAGKYSLGLVAIYLGAVSTLLVRELFKGAILVSEKVGIFAAGLIVKCLLISPQFDDRHIFRGGKPASNRLLAASLAGTLLCFGGLFCTATLAGDQALLLGALGAGIVFYFSCCPFASGDLGRLIDNLTHRGEARDHAKNYLKRKLFRRIARTKPFTGERGLVLMVSFTIGWIYAGFYFGASTAESLLLGLGRIPLRSLEILEKITLLVIFLSVSFMAAVWFLAVVIGTIVSLFSHRPKSAPRATSVTGDVSRAREIISNFPVFSHLDSPTLGEIAKGTHIETYQSGNDVIRQGAVGDTFYIIGKGEASVIATENSGSERYLARLGPGDGFGEMALLETGVRTATVRAKGDLEVAAIGKEDFLKTLQESDIPPNEVTTLLRSTHALLSSDVFSGMTPSALAHIVGTCSRRKYAPGAEIIRQGDPGDSFFIIESGNVDVLREGSSTPVAMLGPGDYFGELALLLGKPRSATVAATTPCVVLRLNKDGLQSVLTRDFDVAIRMENIMDERTSAPLLRPS